MGFFGNLFEKKYCAVCGEEIKLLGNKKLADGNFCKNCESKLSPWFRERRQSTVEEIKDQLAWREDNRRRVEEFQVTRTLGERTKVYIDEGAGRFIVTSESNFQKSNPDVLNLSDCTGVRTDVDQSRSEIMKKDEEGKSVSYTPKRYTYSYDVYCIIDVNNPYYDEMRFRLNDNTIRIENGIQGREPDPSKNVEYVQAISLGEEIKGALMGVAPAAAASPSGEPAKVICPWCQASTVPNEKGCCEYCGGSLV